MNQINGVLGPEGVQQRMQEIQRRMDAVLGPSFNSYLSKSGKSLWGPINGNSPLDPMGSGNSITPKAPPEIKQMIASAAKDAGVDETLLDSLVATESAYDPSARSKTGALGLCQLMPGTAQMLGVSDPTDPVQNLQGGARYLSQLIKQFKDVPLALAAYNAGPGAVTKYGNQVPPFPETQDYVRKIMGLVSARKTQ